MHGLSLYARYASISLRAQLQYRASVVMQSIGHFVITGVEFVGMWALFDRFGQLRGWTLPQVAVLYGMISSIWSLSDSITRGFDAFASLLKGGDFDRLLLRPRSTVLQLAGQELTLRRIGRLAQGALVLAWALAQPSVRVETSTIVLMPFTILCGVCMFFGLMVMQATSAFWTTESLEVWNSFTYGGVFMSQHPLSIYRPWFRKFFTFVIPLACVCYFPCVAIAGRDDPLGTSRAVQWLAPLAGPVFLLISLQLWKLGVRRYHSTGS